MPVLRLYCFLYVCGNFTKVSSDLFFISRDARIASLEQSSLETEKLVAEARSDVMKQMDEVHTTNRKCAQLEAK